MRALSIAILAGFVLASVPALADAQAQQAKPPVQTPPAAQKPTAPAATQKPATPPATQKPATPPPPFPEGSKVAYVNLNGVAAESVEGRGYSAQVQTLQQRRQGELDAKNKAIIGLQQKAQQGANTMSESAIADLNRQIEKQQVELQRAQQDAQTEIQELTQRLQLEFQRKIMPIIEQVAQKRGLHLVFSTDAGIVFANPGLDLTDEVIKAFDASLTRPTVPQK